MIIKVRILVLVTLAGMTLKTSILSQGAVFGIMAGPSLSNQRVNGFPREPFLRYHALVFLESTSEINPNALYARLGYHIKGSAVNVQRYYDINNVFNILIWETRG